SMALRLPLFSGLQPVQGGSMERRGMVRWMERSGDYAHHRLGLTAAPGAGCIFLEHQCQVVKDGHTFALVKGEVRLPCQYGAGQGMHWDVWGERFVALGRPGYPVDAPTASLFVTDSGGSALPSHDSADRPGPPLGQGPSNFPARLEASRSG